MTVAVLFARSDSVYKTLPGVDVWDADRDARNFAGGMPVVAHPPCRAWGRLRHFAKPVDGERDLAFFARDAVRQWGGVLEHPAGSSFWRAGDLPRPEDGRDRFGGWTLSIRQFWFGHRADKNTWLYIVGAGRGEVPAIPLRFGRAEYVVSTSHWSDGSRGDRSEISKAEREHTPVQLAEWLCELARLTAVRPIDRGASLTTCKQCFTP